MRKVLFGAVMIVLICASYIAWPLWSAWQLRQAVKSGNIVTIERKVDWHSVRATVKASLARYAGLWQRHGGRYGARRPGLWQRIKSRYARSAIEKMVNKMVTPQGLPKLYAARETYRHKLRPALGYREPIRALAGTWFEGGRIAKFADSLKRIERIVFTSLTRVEIEFIDRYRPDRHYISVLQLENFDWKLVGLRLIQLQ